MQSSSTEDPQAGFNGDDYPSRVAGEKPQFSPKKRLFPPMQPPTPKLIQTAIEKYLHHREHRGHREICQGLTPCFFLCALCVLCGEVLYQATISKMMADE
jgi:hypothetical protein